MVHPTVLTIDFWGTLFVDADESTHHKRVRQQAYDTYLRDAGFGGAERICETFYETVDAYVKSAWEAGHAPTRVMTIQSALRHYGGAISESAVEGLLDLTYDLSTHQLVPEPTAGALNFVNWASNRWPLYLISDTYVLPGRCLDQILEKRGFPDCFAGKLYSDQLGKRKPDPSLIGLVAAKEGTSPDRIIHIGDSPDTDGRLALLAGARCIIVNPTIMAEQQEKSESHPLPLYCQDFRHVAEVLRYLDEAPFQDQEE